MNTDVSQSLAALRDIHLPDPVSIWPLAVGWWMLAGLLLLLAVGAAVLVRARRRRERSWTRAAATELASIEAAYAAQRDVVTLAASLSSLLRRAVLARLPEERIASLYGQAWYDFLCRDASAGAPESTERSPAVVREMTETAYAGASAATVHPDEWIAFVRSWIGAAT